MRTIVAALIIGWGSACSVARAAEPQAVEMKRYADRLLQEGQTGRAISVYQRVLRHEKGFANAYYNLATAHYLRGDLKESARTLEIFIQLRPYDAEALYNLGCLKLRLGALKEARGVFLLGAKCSPDGFMAEKIHEALHLFQGLDTLNPQTQRLIASLLSL